MPDVHALLVLAVAFVSGAVCGMAPVPSLQTSPVEAQLLDQGASFPGGWDRFQLYVWQRVHWATLPRQEGRVYVACTGGYHRAPAAASDSEKLRSCA